MSARWHARPVAASDLPLLAAWLPAGADLAVPAATGPAGWWVALGGTGQPLACLRLNPPIGLQRPRHWYHVGCVVHAAPELALYHRQTTLLLGNDHTGASELADLACAPSLSAVDQAGSLQALLAAAQAHLAHWRAEHGETLIVELPGVADEAGRSPFWHGLGRHFYAGDLAATAHQHGPDWRSHVAALLPRQPVYTAFLPEAARAAIGQVAPPARAWLDALGHAGWRYSHHIGLIDGGPVLAHHTASWLAG